MKAVKIMLLASCLAAAAGAAPAFAEQSAPAGAEAGAQSQGEKISAELAKIASEAIDLAGKDPEIKKGDLTKMRAFIDNRIMPLADKQSLGMLAMGKHWRGLDEQRKKEAAELLVKLMSKTYSRALAEGAGSQIKLNAARIDGEAGKATGKIIRPGKPEMSVAFELGIESGGSWKIKDLQLEGVSVIQALRSSLGSVIEQKGVDGMLDELRQKVGK